MVLFLQVFEALAEFLVVLVKRSLVRLQITAVDDLVNSLFVF
jgi:hypothetical protein